MGLLTKRRKPRQMPEVPETTELERLKKMPSEDLWLLAESSLMECSSGLANSRTRYADERGFHLENSLIHVHTAFMCVGILNDRQADEPEPDTYK